QVVAVGDHLSVLQRIAGDDAVADAQPGGIGDAGMVVAGDGDMHQFRGDLAVVVAPAAAVLQCRRADRIALLGTVAAQGAVDQTQLATVVDGRAAAQHAVPVVVDQGAGDVGLTGVVDPAAFATVVVVLADAGADAAVANVEHPASAVVDAAPRAQRTLAAEGLVVEYLAAAAH